MATERINKRLSVGYQFLFGSLAILSAVVLPQIFHVLGDVLGVHNALGEMLLPMHLPIITVGLIAGKYVGLIAGVFAPVISMLISGMPSVAVLPFMMIELLCYGFSAGLLKDSKIPVLCSVMISQVFGRVARLLATIAALYVFKIETVAIFSVFSAVYKGLIGIVLQWIIVTLFVYAYKRKSKL